MKTDMISRISSVKDDVDKLDKFKANVDAINHALSLKADAILVETFLDKKANIIDLIPLKTSIETLLQTKLDNESFNAFTSTTNQVQADTSRELALKGNTKDIHTLIELKANALSLERFITQCNKELNSRVTQTQ